MRHILFGILFSLVVALPAFAATSGVELNLKGDQVFLVKDGKSTALDQKMFPAQPIDDTDMRFLGIGPDDAKKQDIAPGLYIFNGQGKPVAFVDTDLAEFCADVKFSPDGKMLAMDAGMSLNRSWLFFSYPAMKPMGEIGYYQAEPNPTIIWVGDKGVLVSIMAESDHGRSCEYDPCGPVSVSYYDFKAEKSTKLLVGTDLCDYTLTGLETDGITVTAASLCLPSSKEWKSYPGEKPTKAVTAKLPQADQAHKIGP